MSDQPSPCEHNYVDRIGRTGVYRSFTNIIIYCTKCGDVAYKGYL